MPIKLMLLLLFFNPVFSAFSMGFSFNEISPDTKYLFSEISPEGEDILEAKFPIINGLYEGEAMDDGTPSSLYRWWGRWAMVTLSPNASLHGIVHTGKNDQEYMKTVFGLIVQEAHDLAKGYLDQGQYNFYYSFMTLSLLIPFHESHLMHFRLNVPDMKYSKAKKWRGCSDDANQGSPRINYKNKSGYYVMPRESDRKHAVRSFKKVFRNQNDFILSPNCKDLQDENYVVQLMGSGMMADFGIMQISTKYHTPMIARGEILDLRKTIRYGLEQVLFPGFKKKINRKNRVPCILDGEGNISLYELVREVWGSTYNGGGTCRISDKKSAYRSNDVNFQRKMYEFIHTGNHPYAKYLKGPEKIVFNDVLKYFKQYASRKYRVKSKRLNIRIMQEGGMPKCGVIINDNQDFILNAFTVLKDGKTGYALVDPNDVINYLTVKGNKKCNSFKKALAKSNKKNGYSHDFVYIAIYHGSKNFMGKIAHTKKDREIGPVVRRILEQKYLPEKKVVKSFYEQAIDDLYVVTVKERLNIRNQPTIYGSLVCGGIKRGEVVKAVRVIDKKWAEIDFGGRRDLITTNSRKCKNIDKFYLYLGKGFLESKSGFKVTPILNKGSTGSLYRYPMSIAKKQKRLIWGGKYLVIGKSIEGKFIWYKVKADGIKRAMWARSSEVREIED